MCLVPERAYIKFGFGAFQSRGFKDTEGEYVKKNLTSVPMFDAGIGYMFSDHISSDINIQYIGLHYRASAQGYNYKQNAHIIAGFVNLYCSLSMDAFFYPYITAGVGISRNNAGNLSIVSSGVKAKGKITTNFAWNIGTGIILDTISRDYFVNIGYRYVDFGVIRTHSISSRVRYALQKVRGQQCTVSLVFKL